jgi:hypothetical protein
MIRRPHLHRIVASILLVAMLLHALVPAGFMPRFGNGDRVESGWLAICPASALAAALQARAEYPHAPTGPICHGSRVADGGSVIATTADDPADPGNADHHGCPFAASTAAALPTSTSAAAFDTGSGREVRASAGEAEKAAMHLLPPARGPPRSRVV